MACTFTKDKLTKNFADKGAMDPTGKITDRVQFDLLNNAYGDYFNNRYKLPGNGKPFQASGNKATPNEDYLTKLDTILHPAVTNAERFESEVKGNGKPASNEVKKLFELNPELSKIGTPEQYQEYIEGIFPDSTVKDIVYHGSSQKLNEFKVNRGDSEVRKVLSLGSDEALGIYLTSETSYAKRYGDVVNPVLINVDEYSSVITESMYNEFTENKEKFSPGEIKNIKGNVYAANYETYANINAEFKSKLGDPDTVIAFGAEDSSKVTEESINEFYAKNLDEKIDIISRDPMRFGADEIVIFDPKRTHILGSKNDLNQFSAHVAKKAESNEGQTDIRKQKAFENINDFHEKIYSNKYNDLSLTYSNSIARVLEHNEDVTQAKIDRMERAFDAVVLIDRNMSASGALLSSTHTLSKVHGKPVILINPDKLFSDTVFHEFGHLYIELLGGQNDPKVKEAIEMLRGSKLWQEVANNYPELDASNLEKEVLATALGLEGNKIFESQEDESAWQTIKRVLLDILSRLFKLPPKNNVIEQLATEMLENRTRHNGTTKFNALIDQLSKYKLEKPSQKSIGDLFKRLDDEFRLEESDHTYHNQESGEVYTKSSSAFAKSITPSRNNESLRGDINLKFEPKDELTPGNVTAMMDKATIPWALDRALQDFFEGNIGEGNLPVEADSGTTWQMHYAELQKGNFAKKTDTHLLKNLDAINEAAREAQLNLDKPTIMGTMIHENLEVFIEELKKGNDKATLFPAHIKDEHNKIEPMIRTLIKNGLANGSQFFTEQILFSDTAKTPGMADLIEITKDGKFRIYDFKTMDKYKNDKDMFVNSGYMNQLIIYATMLEEYGIKPADDFMNILNIKVDRKGFDPKDPTGSDTVILDAFMKNIDPNDRIFNTDYRKAKSTIVSYFTNPKHLTEFDIQTKEMAVLETIRKIERGIEDYTKMTDTKTGKFQTTNAQMPGAHLIKDLRTQITKYVEKNNGLILYKYIDTTRTVLEKVLSHTAQNNAILTSEYVQNMNYLLQVSGFIKEVQDFVINSKDNFAIEGKDKKEILKLIEETVVVLNQVKEAHDIKAMELAVHTLAENSNYQQGIAIERYEIEARQKGKKTKEEINEYVYDKIKKQDIQIYTAELQYWKRKFMDGYSNLRKWEHLIADPGMNRSQFVQVTKNILDKVDLEIRVDLDESIPEIVKWYENLGINTKGDPEKVWKDFLVTAKYKDKDGKQQSHTHASVIPEFTSDRREIYVLYQHKIEYYNRLLDKAYKKKDEKLQEEYIQTIKDLRSQRNKLTKKADKTKRVHPDFKKLSTEKQEALRFIHKKLEEADGRLTGASSSRLVREWDGMKIYNLPKMRKSHFEAAYSAEGSIKRFGSAIKDMFRPPADEDEMNIQESERHGASEDNITRHTDIIGNPSFDIPIFYRNQLEDPTLQSFDIPTLLAMNEETTIAYTHKKNVEADLFMITTALKNSTALKTDTLISNKVSDKVKDLYPKSLKDPDNRVLANVQSSINNRFYKRSYNGVYSGANYFGIKAMEALGQSTSVLLLAANFRSASMTAIQGTIYRFVEGTAGEHFTNADVIKGSKKAYGDMKGLIADTQSRFPTSKTNLLIRRFGLETQYKALVNKFVQDNFVTKNMDQATLFSVTSMAETMVTANLMYTLLGNIKVMNADGKYINKEGKVVPKKDAMSLDEAYEVEDGKLKLHQDVVFTENNLNQKYHTEHDGEKTVAATEISNYIRSIYADLYGQYNQDMKSVIEMNVLGKLAMSMRKWLPRGTHRRWRGVFHAWDMTFDDLRDPNQPENRERRFYSQDQKVFQEGFYTTGLRYLYSVKKELEDKSKALTLLGAMSSVKNRMTTHEQANLKRSVRELGIIAVTGMAAVLVAMIAQRMDDDDERHDSLYLLAYLIERLNLESLTFVWPPELMTNLENPAASVNTIKRITDLIDNIFWFDIDSEGSIDWNINNRYERGLRKGQLKVGKNTEGVIPAVKSIKQFGGILGFDTDENIEEIYEFMRR